MRKQLIILILLLFGPFAYGQVSVIAGVNFYSNSALELGLTFKNIAGVKAIAMCDWRRTYNNMVKDDNKIEKTVGKPYRLMYGGGLVINIPGPFWVGVNVGYGWKGKYIFDESSNRMCVTDHIEGLDVGLDVIWLFSEYFYAIAGYETIPKGFKSNRPVNDLKIGIGMLIPL